MSKRLKIVWICHFVDVEMEKKLPLWKKSTASASWILSTLAGFRRDKDLDIYVISPHNYLKHSTHIVEDNIHFYFIPYGCPIWHRSWPHFFPLDAIFNYHLFRNRVKRIVNQIKPDIINLIGAENAYYSSSVLDYINKYQILITIQGFISRYYDQNAIKALHLQQKKQVEYELKILKAFSNFGGESDSKTYISNYNSNFKFYKFYFPPNEKMLLSINNKLKKYDCVFYGRVVKEKGINDFIKIITILKAEMPHIKSCVIGSDNYEKYMAMAQEYNCANNIDFLGFMPTQKELFAAVQTAKIHLVPTYFDCFPTTIRESMFLKVAVVSYATGGIPYINEHNEENIVLVECGDFAGMAVKAKELLTDNNKINALINKAYIYAQQEFGLESNTEKIKSAYKVIIDKYES